MKEQNASESGWLFAAGGLLIIAGAANAVLALTVDTCTQGSADSLYGYIITLPLYLLGFGLTAAKPQAGHLALPVLLSPLAIWHTAFAARFAYGHVRAGIGQCDAFEGRFAEAYTGPTGGELELIGGWLAVSLIFWGGTLAMWLRSRHR